MASAPGTLGAHFIQRDSGTQARAALQAQAVWTNSGVHNSVAPSIGPVSILGSWFQAFGSPHFFVQNIISGFAILSPFNSDAERLEYKGIWDTFQAALSTPRGQP